MSKQRGFKLVWLISLTALALFAPDAAWPVAAQSPQADGCDNSFEYAGQWGGFGSGNGQFKAPVAIAIDREGNIHVVDRDNARIEKFSPPGAWLRRYGNEDGRMMINPNGIEVGPNGHMYIADTGQHRILIYHPSGQIIGGWKDGDGSEWRMINPWGVTGWEYDGTKNVYVVDRNACQILRFHSNGQFIDDWGHCDPAPYLPVAPQDVAAYPNNGSSPPNFIYIADAGGNRIMKFDYRLSWLFNWGTPGAGEKQFNQPGSVASDAKGCVYVADTGNHRIQIFNAHSAQSENEVQFVAQFGSHGNGKGQFQSPRGVAVDAQGCVYVADTGNNRIQFFCPPRTTSVTGIIPPGGGSLTSPADQTTYSCAAGTFPSPVALTHTPRLGGSVPLPRQLDRYRSFLRGYSRLQRHRPTGSTHPALHPQYSVHRSRTRPGYREHLGLIFLERFAVG